MNLNVMPKKPINPLDRDQRAFIEAELRRLKHSFQTVEREKPARVRKAQKILRAWNRSQNARNRREFQKYERAVRRVNEEMLFGDVRKALVMLRKFRGPK